MKDSLVYLLHKLAFVLDQQSDDALHQNFGFGFSQFRILFGAKHCAGLTQSDVARFLNQTEAGVSRQLKELKGEGLITVRQDKENRRRHIVVLTEKGLELTNEAMAVLQETHASVVGSLGFKEQQMVTELLGRLLTKAKLKQNFKEGEKA